MYQGYLGGNNDNPMMYPNQNYPQMNQQSAQSTFNPYSGMMKQSSGGLQKTSDTMGHSTHPGT